MSDTTAQPEVFEYQAEMQKLLDILVHSLYTEREIFLRELISNASDALSKVQFTALTESEVADKDADLDIRIAFDDQANTLEVIDSGCGMTREELVQNLGTIASSGTLKFLQEAKDRNQSTENLIGQFGVGFYSVFMVAQKVEVTTRSWRLDAEGCSGPPKVLEATPLRPRKSVLAAPGLCCTSRKRRRSSAKNTRLRASSRSTPTTSPSPSSSRAAPSIR